MIRRDVLISLAGLPAGGLPTASRAAADAAANAVVLPADFGAHPAARTEWWYVTGWLSAGSRKWGFQVTFFRTSTGVGRDSPSRFAPRELVSGHAALTDLTARRQWHDQRLARTGFGIARAATGNTDVALRDWHLTRSGPVEGGRYVARVASAADDWALSLTLDSTQPPLLQGDAGRSRKGPGNAETSLYYTEPQLRAGGTLTRRGTDVAVSGRAWLDHEWSDTFLPAGAVGWDWIGMNLNNGSALTAFRLRRADGTSVYAGGSFRPAGGQATAFGPNDVTFVPGRLWRSPASHADYPVEWTVRTPQGTFTVRALLDAQELDSRASTGAWYWEGLSELHDPSGASVGLGYLEMTGRAGRLVI